MRHLRIGGFAVLLVATVAAFFVTQHLKVQNPFINGAPRADPSAINPVNAGVCADLAGRRVRFDRTRIGFFLQHNAGRVDVYVVDSDGRYVATAGGSGRYVQPGPKRYVFFSWDGHDATTGRVAADGTYYFRVALDDRTIELTKTPVRVITTPPHPAVTRVVASEATVRRGPTGPAVIDPTAGGAVTIDFTRGSYLSTRVEILRTSPTGPARIVFSFGAYGPGGQATWNGRIHQRPAPAGTYLIGLSVRDAACNAGSFPIVNPPPSGSTPHAGVTVRYLAATPPLTPVPAGTDASVVVDSGGDAYTWQLSRAGSARVLAHGSVSGSTTSRTSTTSGTSTSSTPASATTTAEAPSNADGAPLKVPLPAGAAGLYDLSLRLGSQSTAVPLVSYATSGVAGLHVLVVLPALTWTGDDPVDDTGDGLPDTLGAEDQIVLDRPFADGLPGDLGDELGVLGALRGDGDAVQLTTDVGLAEGVGPTLAGHSGILLDGTFTWVPPSLASALRAVVAGGGRVASFGIDSLLAEAALGHAHGRLVAGPPHSLGRDPFGAVHNPPGPPGGLLTVLDDGLGIFGDTPALSGYGQAEVITPPSGTSHLSEAGVGPGAPDVVGFRLGRGDVVEVGLGSFGTTLAQNVSGQALLSHVFRLLDS